MATTQFLHRLLKKISQILGGNYELVSLQFAVSIGNSLAKLLGYESLCLIWTLWSHSPGFLSPHLLPTVEALFPGVNPLTIVLLLSLARFILPYSSFSVVSWSSVLPVFFLHPFLSSSFVFTLFLVVETAYTMGTSFYRTFRESWNLNIYN